MELTDDQLRTTGITVSTMDIKKGYMWDRWAENYNDFYPHAPHKVFEHYATYMMMQPLKSGSLIMDVAADVSPFIWFLDSQHYINGYTQDVSYDGDYDNQVSGLAADIPEAFNGRVDTMTLHCAFEHFEGDEDMRFIQNCDRLLSNRGQVIIAPLYTWHEYTEIPPQPSPNTGFGRFYDVESFSHRVLDQLSEGLKAYVQNISFEGEYRFRALVIEREEM